jgi:hypothetical protein
MKIKVFIFLIALIVISTSCSGGNLFDLYGQDRADFAQEFEDGHIEANSFINARNNNPCLDDILAGVPTELQRCGIQPLQRNLGGTLIIVRCPHGCKTSGSGCEIKGGISLDSGEKIYHLPGQESYKDRVIRPQYGERWFSTELDAIANGWQKAEN